MLGAGPASDRQVEPHDARRARVAASGRARGARRPRPARRARGQSADASLWSYGIAHKIAHELKLKADLATWWREKSALSLERRLADFFSEIVLANTTAPVTVFVDDIEHTIGLPFAAELFAALRDCDARREAEPDFKRLTFVLLGVASLRQLVPATAIADARSRPLLAAAETIELGDFTPEESYQLALGFGGEQALAQALMDRVCVWTHGHPYLTQKVARGVARKGGKLEDVERVVREQLLLPGALQDEPTVQHARALLTARTPAARQARKVLRRVARGAKVVPPRDPAVLDVLRLSGVAGVDAGGALRYRNRIFKEVLGARWLKTVTPIGWGRWAAAAAIFAVAALGVFWYSEYLPRPYIRTLTDPRADRAAVEDAYRRLFTRCPDSRPARKPCTAERCAIKAARPLRSRRRSPPTRGCGSCPDRGRAPTRCWPSSGCGAPSSRRTRSNVTRRCRSRCAPRRPTRVGAPRPRWWRSSSPTTIAASRAP